MNSLIYQGEVSHARLAPVKHRFRYSVYFYAFDINELPELARQNPLFGYNQLRPVAIHDKDYLQANSLPLQQKLRQTSHWIGLHLTTWFGRSVQIGDVTISLTRSERSDAPLMN